MEYTVSSPLRLDQFLAENASGLTRSRAQQLIRDGAARVNDAIVTKPSHRLQSGDTVTLEQRAITNEEPKTISPINLDLPVLYEDAVCLVINKPAGYAVHPAPSLESSEPTILHGIAHLFQESGLSFSPDAVLVHRLDRETTGCLLVAKSLQAHEHLQQEFAARRTSKTYLALVAGVPDPPEAVIDAPVGRNLTDRTRMSVLKTSVSREARTTYRMLDSAEDCALLRCDLHTGRTHQARVHLASLGHPLLGDETYGSDASRALSVRYGVGGLCLHARHLGFTSPADDVWHEVEAPVPEVFQKALDATGLRLRENG